MVAFLRLEMPPLSLDRGVDETRGDDFVIYVFRIGPLAMHNASHNKVELHLCKTIATTFHKGSKNIHLEAHRAVLAPFEQPMQ